MWMLSLASWARTEVKTARATSPVACSLGGVGTPRLLKLFAKYNMKTSWAIPGHSWETFPDQMKAVRDAGHEIVLHGYSHENPIAMTPQQEKDVLEHTYKLHTSFCGKPPVGYVAPWCENSQITSKLLLDHGIEYSRSNMHRDAEAYYGRNGDSWTKIDYDGEAKEWMKPLVRGTETGLVEIPASWYLDDMEPFMFIKQFPNSHGWVDPKVVEDLWKGHFSYFYREYEEFVFPITIHPDVSGHPHVILMLERFIEWVNTHEGAQWVTMKEMSDDFKHRNPAPGGNALPVNA
ncbi:glycoside hydrolase/deacetylase [Calocera viscosa TUFC12733]|uniref:Glycoside hydrolase/deacetylase n=1 Tax=Calocera viscosa (strain TUFC12733) TaxID=1330018 RepID=A0A167MHG9_CALVF|nr:glycoside hydrolase/deacetylase [Calocera viscosa TUFC12733]